MLLMQVQVQQKYLHAFKQRIIQFFTDVDLSIEDQDSDKLTLTNRNTMHVFIYGFPLFSN